MLNKLVCRDRLSMRLPVRDARLKSKKSWPRLKKNASSARSSTRQDSSSKSKRLKLLKLSGQPKRKKEVSRTTCSSAS